MLLLSLYTCSIHSHFQKKALLRPIFQYDSPHFLSLWLALTTPLPSFTPLFNPSEYDLCPNYSSEIILSKVTTVRLLPRHLTFLSFSYWNLTLLITFILKTISYLGLYDIILFCLSSHLSFFNGSPLQIIPHISWPEHWYFNQYSNYFLYFFNLYLYPFKIYFLLISEWKGKEERETSMLIGNHWLVTSIVGQWSTTELYLYLDKYLRNVVGGSNCFPCFPFPPKNLFSCQMCQTDLAQTWNGSLDPF